MLAMSLVLCALASTALVSTATSKQSSHSNDERLINTPTVKTDERMPMPFPYAGYDAFPASFFGADIWGVENATEMALVAKHQISGWGWQQGCMQSCCSGACNCESSNPVGCPKTPPPGFSPATGHADEEAQLYNQSRAFAKYCKAQAPKVATHGIFVYRQLSTPCWWWQKIFDAFTDTAMRGMFFSSAATGEYCWSSGPIWDFRNATAREYYVQQVIGEVTAEPDSGLNFVFFDGGLGMLAANPHPSPSGHVGGGGNCSLSYNNTFPNPGGKDLNFTDAQRMVSVRACLRTLVLVAEALNAAGIVPIFSMDVPFDADVAASRGFPGLISEGATFTEAEVVAALSNVTWMRYYEWFQSNGWSKSIGMSVDNVMEEAKRGVPVMAHAYGKPLNCSDPNDAGIGSAVAAFLIAQGDYFYFQTSSSVVGGDPWTDSGWCWHPLYDLKCGKPKALAAKSGAGAWSRSFEHCEIKLDQRTNQYSIMHGGKVVSASGDAPRVKAPAMKTDELQLDLLSASTEASLGCALNGVKAADGSCTCDAAWEGAQCERFAFVPTSDEADLNSPWAAKDLETSTWGNQSQHMFGVELTGSCGIGAWQTNSQVVHWASEAPASPWRRLGVALAPQATCPSVATAPNGTLIMTLFGGAQRKSNQRTPKYYPNGDPENHRFCKNGSTPCGFSKHGCSSAANPRLPRLTGRSSGVSGQPDGDATTGGLPDCAHCSPSGHTCGGKCAFPMYAADGTAGPWRLTNAVLDLAMNFSGSFSISAPWISPNGTTHIVLQTGQFPALFPPEYKLNNIGAIIRADSWAGPYTVVARGACGAGEDMFIWRDQRGHFHCVWHNTGLTSKHYGPHQDGAHSFSVDGRDPWFCVDGKGGHGGCTEDTPAPYNTTLWHTHGRSHGVTATVMGTRERPHMLFNDDGSPLALVTATRYCNGSVDSNGTVDTKLCASDEFPGFSDRSFSSVAYLRQAPALKTDEVARSLPASAAFAPAPAPIVRSFDDVRGQPYKVSYDRRSLLVDSKRVLLLGGSFHYPRAAPEEWRGILQAMKDDGLNHLQMYTFWNLHESTRGVYDFSDGSRANITRLLATAAEVGLFVNVRIGPFVCAEWSFGGLPVWLRDLPGVVFRDNNVVWKREMATWVRRVAKELEPFLARNGGPVMMSQIENEYNSGWFGAWEPEEYVEWAGALATNLSLDVPTMMCNGLSANNTLNAMNGNKGSTFAASHAVEYPGQPLLWAEHEMGASSWGPNNPPGPAAEAVSRNLAQWVALGATHHNYYMWYGGNHVARWAGMAISNSYADTAPMHSDRLPNEPLHSHVSRLHKLLAEHAPAILASPMQQRTSLQRGRDKAELVPATVTARLGTIACDAGDAAQQFSLSAGGGTLRAKVESVEVCVVAAEHNNAQTGVSGPPIGTCDGSNSSQIFTFSDEAKGQGTLCSKSGMCLCAIDPIAAKGAVGIPSSEQTVGVSNTSTAQSLDSCKWIKTGGRIMSMVQPPPPAPCTGNSMSLYLGLPEASSHYPALGNSGNHTIAEAEKICKANFVCAGFIYHAATNDTAIDCSAVHEIMFQEAITNHLNFDKSWKTFTKHRIAYPYPDPRDDKGRQTQRCLTSGFASLDCGVCASTHDPCTCAYVYGSGASALAFVQNDGTTATNFSLPGSVEVLSVAPNSISLVTGGVTLFNTATVEGCLDPESCSLPTVRQNTTIAGNSSAGGSSVLRWRRWTEPALLSYADMAAATQSQRPLEQLNVTQDRTDYLFYQREFSTHEAAANASLYIGTRLGSALSVFIDGKFMNANVDLQRPYSSSVTLPINIGALSAGIHNLTILSAAMGISNYPSHGTNGPHGQLPAHGITGDVILEAGSSNESLTAAESSWSHLAGLAGERKRVFACGSIAPPVWASSSSVPGARDTAPLSWFRTTFKVPSGAVASAAAGNASVLLDPTGMARGHFYLNGADLGRFYPGSPGAATAGLGGALYLPPSLLKGTNVLVLGEELGATQPTAVRVILSTLASIKN